MYQSGGIKKREDIKNIFKEAVPIYSQSLINNNGGMMEKINATKNKMINYFVASVEFTV